MTIEAIVARAFQLVVALTGAYTVALWFALIVWTFRDIESRSRSVIAQIFSTLVVVLFFIPGALVYLLLRPRETLDEAFGRALEEEYLLQDLEDLRLCATCHHPLRDDFVVCPHCYTELRRNCPSCARLVDVSWALCPYCTTELAQELDDRADEEATWRETHPSFLPGPLRLLRERTEVRVRHEVEHMAHDEAPPLPAGETAPLIARETEAAHGWDDVGKQSWIVTRAREVLRPLIAATPPPNGHDGHGDQPEHLHANGHGQPSANDHPVAAPARPHASENDHAGGANGRAAEAPERIDEVPAAPAITVRPVDTDPASTESFTWPAAATGRLFRPRPTSPDSTDAENE